MVKASKGSAWERDVCKFLSKWIQGEEKPYIFWRGRGSGAMFTNQNMVGEAFAGDIYQVREEGQFLVDRFSIECKNGYKEASLDKFLKNNKSDPIKDFWIQTIDDARRVKKQPMLIFKKKGMPTPWLFTSKAVYQTFRPELDIIRHMKMNWAVEEDETKLPTAYIFDYKLFFDIINPEMMKGRM